jgi:hypothetical protein
MTTGSLSPATYPADAVTIRCDRCSRAGRYQRRTLIERYGRDAAMPDVLSEITACDSNHRLSVERCEAYYAELRIRA